SPLADVQHWSELGVPLFESLLLFENYPEVHSLWQGRRELRVRQARGYQDSNYPLTVVVVPRDGLWLRIKYDGRRFERPAIERMLEHYKRLLLRFADDTTARLRDLALVDGPERRQ